MQVKITNVVLFMWALSASYFFMWLIIRWFLFYEFQQLVIEFIRLFNPWFMLPTIIITKPRGLIEE